MKKTITVILFLISTACFSQNIFMPTYFFVTKRENEAKRIIKRFDRAVIRKDVTEQKDGMFYIELEENDINEYYKRFGIKLYCIPKRKIDKIILLMLINDNGNWNDEKNHF